VKKTLLYFGLLAATLTSLFAARGAGMHFDARQILSILVFSSFIYGTLLFAEFRLAFAFGGIALLLGLNLLSLEQFTESANLRVIIFLVGMFLVIGFLEEHGFFEHIIEALIRWIGPRPKALLMALMLMATISAAVVDEVTSILFMSGAMLHLTGKYRLRPVPFIIMLVFATNIGSAASSIGNPIGVMIAFSAGFSFLEFLRWSAPIALVVNVVTYMICRWWFATDIRQFEAAIHREHECLTVRNPEAALVGVAGSAARAGAPAWAQDSAAQLEDEAPDVSDVTSAPSEHGAEHPHAPRLGLSWVVFGLTLLLLVTHGLSEKWLGRLVGAPGGSLREGTMMVGAALTMGCVVLLLRGAKARELVERRVDWWTLTFFMMLFASVGTLEHTQVTKVVAARLIDATGGSETALVQIVGWSTGILSAFLDNVLAVATFMPVIHDVRLAAAPEPFTAAIYWMMLFGGTFLGNATVIGSTANIIAVGLLEKRGHGSVSFMEWFKIGSLVGVVSLAIASLLLAAQSQWLPKLPPPAAHAPPALHGAP
jgi:Na+/H+ antiporter NhaD/arsenite permease-like protein